MKDPQLIDLLRSLSEKELKDFKKFLSSPFYNTSPTIIKLFSVLKKYYPHYSPPEYSKETVFAELLPGKKYNSLLLNEYYYLLSNLTVEFIKQMVLKKHEVKFNIDLLNEYRIRGLKKNFDKLYAKIENKVMHDRYDYSVLHSIYDLNAARTNSIPVFSNEDGNSKNIDQKYNLHLTYLLNIVIEEYLTTLLSYKNESTSYDTGKESILKKLEADKVIYNLYQYIKKYNPFDFNIELHFSMIEMLNEPDNIKKYYDNKELITKNFDRMSNNELDHLLAYLKAFSVAKTYLPETRKEFLKEYIELELLTLEKKIFLNDETSYFKNTSFRNLLITCANQKDKKKVELLIDYSKYLRPETRSDFRNMASAYYYYLSGALTEAQTYLKKIITGNKQLELDANFLRLKIYFELKDVINGIDKIHSVRRIVNYSRDLSEKRKKKYRSFLNYLEKLFRKFEKNDTSGIIILFREILQKGDAIYLEWFEEKYREFSSKVKHL